MVYPGYFSRYSDMATGWTTEEPRLDSWRGKYFFSVPHRLGRPCVQHSLLFNGCQGIFPGGKRPERERDRSPPSTAEVNNAWIYISTPLYIFLAWCLIKHKDKYTCTFTLKCTIFCDVTQCSLVEVACSNLFACSNYFSTLKMEAVNSIKLLSDYIASQ
jgi:hypothetical protein